MEEDRAEAAVHFGSNLIMGEALSRRHAGRNHMKAHAVMGWTVLVIAVAGVSTARAGARIDLRPEPPANGVSYQRYELVNVDVFMVDTGNPQGNIAFRGLFLDFEDSTSLSFPGADGWFGGMDDNEFDWNNPFGIGAEFPDLPRTSLVFPDVPPWGLPTIPDGGELLLGQIMTRIDALPATLDVLNADAADPNLGGRADFGFGVPGDPVTTWRAFTGDITGGVLEIPEPATLIGMLVVSAALFPRRSVRARKM